MHLLPDRRHKRLRGQACSYGNVHHSGHASRQGIIESGRFLVQGRVAHIAHNSNNSEGSFAIGGTHQSVPQRIGIAPKLLRRRLAHDHHPRRLRRVSIGELAPSQ
jgi:hypothetical protein